MMRNRIGLVLLTVLLLLGLSGCSTVPLPDGLVFGTTYEVNEGQTIESDLVIFGGSLKIAEGGTMRGNVAIFGGTAAVDGLLDGNLMMFGGTVSLGETAVVSGDVSTFGGVVDTREGAQVQGRIGKSTWVPSDYPEPPVRPYNPLAMVLDFTVRMIWGLLQAIGMAILAAVSALMVLRAMERVGRTLVRQPLQAGAMGGLSILAGVVLIIAMTITLILIPFALISVALFLVAILFGWFSLGLLLGDRISGALQQTWSSPVSAGIGTLVLTLAAQLANLVPCVGWVLGFAALCAGLGAVVFTRFGTSEYPPILPGTGLSGQPAMGIEGDEIK